MLRHFLHVLSKLTIRDPSRSDCFYYQAGEPLLSKPQITPLGRSPYTVYTTLLDIKHYKETHRFKLSQIVHESQISDNAK